MNRRRLLYFFIAFLLTTVVAGSAFYFYEFKVGASQNVVSNKSTEVIDFISSRVKEAATCDVEHALGYISYEDTEWTNNNKFGLYIYAENRDFFEIAQNLVNSRGGDWGYVLIPYNVKDRDIDKWQRVFDMLRNKHLIPIIQLWDVDTNDYEEQTEEAAEFLNQFVWPIKPRYISVYNEMNDARFWYGRIDPEEYARILDFTIDTFKGENNNFFMINGAFNITAPSDGAHMDAFEFMYRMHEEKPRIFEKLDGWASHPYPQPNFSGGPYATGRWSIRAYEEELKYLKNRLGVKKDLPVFITETGWAHAEGKNYTPSYLSVDVISEYIKLAFEEVWLKDDRVRAVTPFTIKYEPPFDHFSWINADNVPYRHYDVVKAIKKVAGNPPVLAYRDIDIFNCR